MKYLIKLNILSSLYALMFFIMIQLAVNIYRISRITGLDIGHIDRKIFIFDLILFIASSILFFIFTKKYMNGKKANYFTTILWLPYLILFIYLFASWLPITEPADKPAPVTGLIILGAAIIYPLYIVIINLFATIDFKSDSK